MAEEGLSDVVGIMNCFAKLAEVGTPVVMNVAVAAGKGSIYIVQRLIDLGKYILIDKEYQKNGGKVKEKVIQTKYQDLMFSSFPTSMIDKERKDLMSRGCTEEQLKEINSEAVKKRIEKLAKKAGLDYYELPNFVVNEQTGKPDYRIAYSHSKEAAYQEVKTQLHAYYFDYYKKTGKLTDEEAEEKTIKTIDPMFEGPLLEMVDKLGIAKVDRATYEKEMKNTYSNYKAPIAIEPSEEKKTDFKRSIDQNEYVFEKSKDNVTTFYTKDILQNKVEGIDYYAIQLNDYPEAAILVKDKDILKSENTTSGITKISIKKDQKFDVVYRTMDNMGNIVKVKAKMTLNELKQHMEEASQKKTPDIKAIKAEIKLPSTQLSNGRRK